MRLRQSRELRYACLALSFRPGDQESLRGGKGNLTATDTVSLNGQIISENLNFSYQVNPDCTGSASSAPGQEPAHFDFVIVNFGERVTGSHTDPGTTLILNARQQFGTTAGAKQLGD